MKLSEALSKLAGQTGSNSASNAFSDAAELAEAYEAEVASKRRAVMCAYKTPELTRLISSERWIPFAEMMPESPAKGEQRCLLASRVGFEPYVLSPTKERIWVLNPGEDRSVVLSELIEEGVTHWRYLTPPEAT
jgi:hypothetical protein